MLFVGDRAVLALEWRWADFLTPSHADFTEFGGQYETGTYTGGRCHIG